MTFSQPATDNFAAKEWLGHLVLIENVGGVEIISTTIGDNEAVRADVTVLTHPEGPKEFRQTAVFGKALIGTLLRAAPGSQTLGRIAQAPAQPGKNPAWILDKFTEQDAAFAQSYVDSRAAQRAQQTFATPQAAPAPAAVPQAPLPQVPVAAPQPVAIPQAVPQPVAVPAVPVAVPQAAVPVAAPVAAPAPVAVNASALTPEQLASLPPDVLAALQAQAAAPPF